MKQHPSVPILLCFLLVNSQQEMIWEQKDKPPESCFLPPVLGHFSHIQQSKTHVSLF